MGATEHAIYENLRGVVCVCGAPKLDGKSFCKTDYFRLEKADRDALYQPRSNYAEAYRRALRVLGFAEPVLPNDGKAAR